MKYIVAFLLALTSFVMAQMPQAGEQWRIHFDETTWAVHLTDADAESVTGSVTSADLNLTGSVMFSDLDDSDKDFLSIDAGEYQAFLFHDFPLTTATASGLFEMLLCVLPQGALATATSTEGVGYIVQDEGPNGLSVVEETVTCDAARVTASTSTAQGNDVGGDASSPSLNFSVGSAFTLEVDANGTALAWDIVLTGTEDSMLTGSATGHSDVPVELEYFTIETAPFPSAANTWVVAAGNEAEGNVVLCQFSEATAIDTNVFTGKVLLTPYSCQVTLP